MLRARLVVTAASLATAGACAVLVAGSAVGGATAAPSAAHTGTVRSGTVRSGTVRSGTVHSSTVHSGTVRTATTTLTRRAGTRASARAATGRRLPLHLRTFRATRVITVVAPSASSTTATLRAWTKQPGGGWVAYGRAVTAEIGADGVGTASESTSRTPAGSFTLTQAFGAKPDPGTALPYFRTTPSDWWVSQPGPLYNTHQRCSSGCGFTQGSPNEHLYYETPYYNHAVVIDYNTRNSATGVRQGAGSAFFLHVSVGAPTAGCVAIDPRRLIALMRWLRPRAHPRILIGVR